MLVLLLLCAFVSLGLSDELYYGDTYSIRLLRKTQTLEFSIVYGSSSKILWIRGDPAASEGSRVKLQGSNLLIKGVTPRDSGIYRQKDHAKRVLWSENLDVTANEKTVQRTPGEKIFFNFDLKSDSCNIYFIPAESGHEIEKVSEGSLVDYYQETCGDINTYRTCGIQIDHLDMTCNGRFEIRDEFNDNAFVLTVEMESPGFDVTAFGVAIGILFIVLGCCCYLKHCCCKKRSSKKNESESPESAPATNYLTQYDREPAAPRRDQPSETLYPALPSYNPSRPLIHNRPPSVPPAYFEVTAPADVVEEAPILPVPAEDPGPRFELSFASELPLNSDSNLSHVYTSDKLNF